MEWYTLHEYFGPIFYRGHRWTGEITEAFIEIWGPGYSSPDRCDLIQDGVFSRNLPTTLRLKMSDLCPEEKWVGANIPDREIVFNGTRFTSRLLLDTAHKGSVVSLFIHEWSAVNGNISIRDTGTI